MTPTDEIIKTLWEVGEVVFETDYEEEFRAQFSRPGGLFDVVLYSSSNDAMGFLTLKEEREGFYSIVNDTAVNSHTGFVNTPGHGIEVLKKYRKKGIGGALLSLGIGVVQQHYVTRKSSAPFRVVASDITKLGLGCYRTFGFLVTEGVTVSTGEYTEVKTVPDIDMRPWKMPFPLRFIRRLRG